MSNVNTQCNTEKEKYHVIFMRVFVMQYLTELNLKQKVKIPTKLHEMVNQFSWVLCLAYLLSAISRLEFFDRSNKILHEL